MKKGISSVVPNLLLMSAKEYEHYDPYSLFEREGFLTRILSTLSKKANTSTEEWCGHLIASYLGGNWTGLIYTGLAKLESVKDKANRTAYLKGLIKQSLMRRVNVRRQLCEIILFSCVSCFHLYQRNFEACSADLTKQLACMIKGLSRGLSKVSWDEGLDAYGSAMIAYADPYARYAWSCIWETIILYLFFLEEYHITKAARHVKWLVKVGFPFAKKETIEELGLTNFIQLLMYVYEMFRFPRISKCLAGKTISDIQIHFEDYKAYFDKEHSLISHETERLTGLLSSSDAKFSYLSID